MNVSSVPWQGSLNRILSMPGEDRYRIVRLFRTAPTKIEGQVPYEEFEQCLEEEQRLNKDGRLIRNRILSEVSPQK